MIKGHELLVLHSINATGWLILGAVAYGLGMTQVGSGALMFGGVAKLYITFCYFSGGIPTPGVRRGSGP